VPNGVTSFDTLPAGQPLRQIARPQTSAFT
jgi:hypothetical protein